MVKNNTAHTTVVGILLAAGFSRRFGAQNKLTQPLPDGQMIAMRAAQALITALPEAIAVVRKEEVALQDHLAALGYKLAYCEAVHQDMADSFKLGIREAQLAFPQLSGLVIALADMPFIQPQTITQVAQQLAQARIVQPMIHGQPGHPVGFSSQLIAELLTIEGDQGARAVLRAHQAEIWRWPCDDKGILRDIDLPSDIPG